MNLEKLQSSLNELNNQFKSLKAELAAEKAKVQKMPLTIGEVFPGDVWIYPPNRKFKWGYFCKVKSVNKKQNRVEFQNDKGEEDGWNRLDDMLNGQWVLVSRELTPKVKAKAVKL